MFQRLQPSQREYCKRCGEYCEPGEDAIRSGDGAGESWRHVECHGVELVTLVGDLRDRATALGVTPASVALLA